MRKLDDSQLEDFDTEYVVGDRWELLIRCIENDFPQGEFTFLDVGGGNGKMSDKLLERFPHARGTVFDNAEYLLGKNEPNDRKTLVLDSVENLDKLEGKYDLVLCHWLLHHLVSGGYSETRANQATALSVLSRLLTARGRVSVFENIYTGWWIENLPGWLIFELTSIKSLAPLTRRFGANTAGIGVCFLARTAWLRTMDRAGLELLDYAEPDAWIWPFRPMFKVLLHLKRIRVGHFWLRPRGSKGAGS